MANNDQATGIVSSITGEVFALAANGQARPLAAGDSVFEGEVIVSTAGGGAAIAMANGPELHVAEQQSIAIDHQVTGSLIDDTVGSVQAFLAHGATDLSALLAIEAASLPGVESQQGGPAFVDLLRIVEATANEPSEFTTVSSITAGNDDLVLLADSSLASAHAHQERGTDLDDYIASFRHDHGDVLDFNHLLQGASAAASDVGSGTPGDLANYLKFERVGSDTILTVEANGHAAGGEQQTIVFENTNLFEQFGVTNEADSAMLIKSMLLANQLKIDS